MGSGGTDANDIREAYTAPIEERFPGAGSTINLHPGMAPFCITHVKRITSEREGAHVFRQLISFSGALTLRMYISPLLNWLVTRLASYDSFR